jgi:NAD(P)-dependent dehydrogenase (short-subunit alcohol dehydrogenase family)
VTARSHAKAEETLAKAKEMSPGTPMTVLEMDLSSFASVKKAAQAFLSNSRELDILILNAGIMAVPNGKTTDGYEIQMGTNHIGHALLTKLLLPTLQQNAKEKDTRIIVLSSRGSMMSRGFDYSILKTDGRKRTYLGGTQLLYCDTKLANLYFAQQLAARYPDITSVSVHPGIVGTGLVSSQSAIQRFIISVSARFNQGSAPLTPNQGAYNSLWTATVNKSKLIKLINGEYYEPVGELCNKTSYAKDEAAAKKLWEWTEEELKSWTL